MTKVAPCASRKIGIHWYPMLPYERFSVKRVGFVEHFSLHTDFLKVVQMAQLRCYTILLFCQCVTPKLVENSYLDSATPPNKDCEYF